MSLDLIPISELDAVNAMLEFTGASPVSSLPTSGVSSAYIARNMLHRASRQLQAQGWSFNSDSKYSMSPNVDGHILVPDNCLRIDAFYDYVPVVERFDVTDSKRKLYDRDLQTFIFTAPVYVDIVWFMAWEGLPDHARNLLYILAGREFQKKFQTSELIHQITAEDEARARSEFMSEELRRDDDTMLTAPGSLYITSRRV